MFIIGTGPERLFVFNVRVAGFEEIEQIDVNAETEAEAWRLAKVEAEDLYENYTLTLAVKI